MEPRRMRKRRLPIHPGPDIRENAAQGKFGRNPGVISWGSVIQKDPGGMWIRIRLPYPPSINHAYRMHNGHIILSKKARDYKRDVAVIGKAFRIQPFDGPVIMELDVYRPRQLGDLSNRIKILEDALIGVAYHDDEQVVEIRARRFVDGADPRVEVVVVKSNEQPKWKGIGP